MIFGNPKGTLYRVTGGDKDVIRYDPLSILLSTAVQGHEGSYQSMRIEMDNGDTFDGEEINDLNTRRRRGRRGLAALAFRAVLIGVALIGGGFVFWFGMLFYACAVDHNCV